MRRILKAPIRLYKTFISPLLPQACRYHPSCSAYAMEALEKHGAAKGFLLAAMRLSSCHPWSKHGPVDPVPGAFDWRAVFGYKRAVNEKETKL